MAGTLRPTGEPSRLSGESPNLALAGEILDLRGQRVILDVDLARIYGVETRALNQAVKRNAERFPQDFAFQLDPEEFDGLKSQIVISKTGRGGRRSPPWAFTEHGAIMAASLLNSPRALEMSVFVVRGFVRLRDLARTHADLAKQLAALERRVTGHDEDLNQVLGALRQMLEPPLKPRKSIGFGSKEPEVAAEQPLANARGRKAGRQTKVSPEEILAHRDANRR